MYQGCAGTESHKHGVSGGGGSRLGLKQRLAREQNQRRKEQQETRKRRRQRMHDTVRELMAHR